MAKQRSQSGRHRSEERTEEIASGERAADKDPSLIEQGHLGNQAMQARIGGDQVTAGTKADVVDVARPLVERAQLALQVDPADPQKLARLTGILERSHLPNREELAAQITAVESMRRALDAALDEHFGGHDEEARWAVDAVLAAVGDALAVGDLGDGTWHDIRGSIDLSPAVQEGSVEARAEALIGDLATAMAPAGASERATGELGQAVSGVVRSLALALMLEEDEEEEWAEPSVELE